MTDDVDTPSPLRTIGERWRDYARTQLVAASPPEWDEAHHAFYAGAAAALGILGLAGSAALAQEDGGRVIGDMLRDLKAFAQLDGGTPRGTG